MPRSAWEGELSFGLRWMTPPQAKAYLGAALAAGLLSEDGDELRLGVDPEEVRVPVGFRPDPLALAAPGEATAAGGAGGSGRPRKEDPVLDWMRRIAEATGQKRADVAAQMAARQEAMAGHLTAEVAVLWLARDAGLDVTEALADAVAGLTTHAAGSGR